MDTELGGIILLGLHAPLTPSTMRNFLQGAVPVKLLCSCMSPVQFGAAQNSEKFVSAAQQMSDTVSAVC